MILIIIAKSLQRVYEHKTQFPPNAIIGFETKTFKLFHWKRENLFSLLYICLIIKALNKCRLV